MEEDFDLDNILDALNVTGQWQPSPMPMLSDPTLNSQVGYTKKEFLILIFSSIHFFKDS